jgi:hypothetical protein
MPRITSRQAQEKFDEFNAIRRNFPHMTQAEQDAWIGSGKSLREFLGSNRFIEKGFRMNKNGELKLK